MPGHSLSDALVLGMGLIWLGGGGEAGGEQKADRIVDSVENVGRSL